LEGIFKGHLVQLPAMSREKMISGSDLLHDFKNYTIKRVSTNTNLIMTLI